MVIEHGRLEGLDERRRAHVEDMIQWNLRKSGEYNRFVPLGLLQYIPGFKFDTADGGRWEVKRMFKNGQTLVTRDDPEKPTMAVWEKTKLVRVPKDIP